MPSALDGTAPKPRLRRTPPHSQDGGHGAPPADGVSRGPAWPCPASQDTKQEPVVNRVSIHGTQTSSPGTHMVTTSSAGAGRGGCSPSDGEKALMTSSVSCLPSLGPHSIPALLSVALTMATPCISWPWPALEDKMAANGRLLPRSTPLQPQSLHSPQLRNPGPVPAPSRPLCHPTAHPRVGMTGTAPGHQHLFRKQSRKCNNAQPTHEATART